jgi:hypothetical protein
MSKLPRIIFQSPMYRLVALQAEQEGDVYFVAEQLEGVDSLGNERWMTMLPNSMLLDSIGDYLLKEVDE